MSRYIDADALVRRLKHSPLFLGTQMQFKDGVIDLVEKRPTADVVEVDEVSEKIIRKKAEVSDYWQKDVKQYRTMQGYSNIEHDVDNFLRGYNEAVEDILAILDGERREVCSSN